MNNLLSQPISSFQVGDEVSIEGIANSHLTIHRVSPSSAYVESEGQRYPISCGTPVLLLHRARVGDVEIDDTGVQVVTKTTSGRKRRGNRVECMKTLHNMKFEKLTIAEIAERAEVGISFAREFALNKCQNVGTRKTSAGRGKPSQLYSS